VFHSRRERRGAIFILAAEQLVNGGSASLRMTFQVSVSQTNSLNMQGSIYGDKAGAGAANARRKRAFRRKDRGRGRSSPANIPAPAIRHRRRRHFSGALCVRRVNKSGRAHREAAASPPPPPAPAPTDFD